MADPTTTQADALAMGLATPLPNDQIHRGDDAITLNARHLADTIKATEAAAAAAAAKADPDDALQEHGDPAAVFAVVDEDGRRTWLEVAPDGGPTDHAGDKLVPVVAPAVAGTVGLFDQNTDLTGLSFAVVDEDGRRTWLEVAPDGGPTARTVGVLRDRLDTATTTPAAVSLPAGVLRTAPDGEAWSLIYHDTATATATTLATAPEITGLSATADRAFFTVTDATGTATAMTCSLPAGDPAPVAARPALVAWGDSNTAGMGATMAQAWPAVAGSILGVGVYNGGVSSQTSTEIALRQGGLHPAVTVAGDTIPASGPVAVTVTDPESHWRTTYTWNFPGRLAGVAGTLTKDPNNAWTFTRAATGDPVPVPAGSVFYGSEGDDYRADIACIMAGRNTTGYSQALIERDVAAMVAHLTPYVPHFLVMALTRGAGNEQGTASYDTLAAVNGALAATYGPRFVDWPRWIIDNGLAFEGITPTAQDLTDVAADIVPASLRSDGAHFNAAGYHALGHYMSTVIEEKGWI